MRRLALFAAMVPLTLFGCVGDGTEEETSMLDDDRADGMGMFPNEEVLVQGDPIYICDPEVLDNCRYYMGQRTPIETKVVDFHEESGQIIIETQDIRIAANTMSRINMQDATARPAVEDVVGFRAWYRVVSTDGEGDWAEVALPESVPTGARWTYLMVSPAFGIAEAGWAVAGETGNWYSNSDTIFETVELSLPELRELSRAEGVLYIEYRLEIIPALHPRDFERRTYPDELLVSYI